MSFLKRWFKKKEPVVEEFVYDEEIEAFIDEVDAEEPVVVDREEQYRGKGGIDESGNVSYISPRYVVSKSDKTHIAEVEESVTSDVEEITIPVTEEEVVAELSGHAPTIIVIYLVPEPLPELAQDKEAEGAKVDFHRRSLCYLLSAV